MSVFPIRRAALRLLSSPSRPFLSKPRSISTLPSSALRSSTRQTSFAFQRRWESSQLDPKGFEEGTAGEEKEDVPEIVAEEPAPGEVVENEIHAENAAEARESASNPGDESALNLNNVLETMKGKASEAAETVRSVASGSDSRGGFSPRTVAGTRGQEAAPVEPKSTIYIGNLFFDVTEDDLSKEMGRFGTITKCRLIRDSRGLSKGFGYIDFETIAAATKAIETLDQQLFEGRRLVVQYAAYSTRQLDNERSGFARTDRSQKPMNPASKTLFIGNMSFEMTDRDLNSLFKGIKNVIDVRVAIDRRTGQPRGFAHADFVDVRSATEALKVLETKETYGRKLRLDYSYGPSNAPRNQPDSDRERGLRSEDSPRSGDGEESGY